MNDSGGHGGGYPPGAPPAASELPAPGRPAKRRQVRTRVGGVGELPEHLARATAGAEGSTQPPPNLRPRVPTEHVSVGTAAARVPPSIDSHHMLQAMKADDGGQGPGLVVVVTHASGRERTEVFRTTEVSIGRDRSNELVLTGDGISRRHAVLTLGEDNGCTIIDLGSTNGTFVNEQPIERAPTGLSQKDFVTLGEYALRVRPFGEEANVDPSTMQFDVPGGPVIVQNTSAPPGASSSAAPPLGPSSTAPAGPPLAATAAVPAPPRRRTQPPPMPRSAPPPPSVGRRPREHHGDALVPTSGQRPGAAAVKTQPPAESKVAASSAPVPHMKTAEMEAMEVESDEGQGTMAMLDAPGGLVDGPPLAPPPAPPPAPPIAPVIHEPPPAASDGFDIVNEHSVSEQQTRVKELSDMPAPPPGVPSPVTVKPPAPPPGVVVTGGAAPPPPSSSRNRSNPPELPQTGPRSKSPGDATKTPIGMPAPPSRPAAVIASQRQVDVAAASRSEGAHVPPPPRSKNHKTTKASVQSAPPSEPRDEPSIGPDSVVIAGRVTTDSAAALEALLLDSDVTRVSVQVRRVDVERRGKDSPHDGFDFATEEGLMRALARTCERGGMKLDPNAPYARGTLSDGWELFVVRPPAAPNGHLVQLRRVAAISRSLEELEKEGWLSKEMAAWIAKCQRGRCNVLIVSERDDDAETMAGSLASTVNVPPLWVVRDAAVAPKGHPAIVLDLAAPAATLDACEQLASDRVMFPRLRLDAWHALLRSIRRGREGVAARLRGPSIDVAIDRTAAGLSAYIGEQQRANSKVASSVPTFRAWLSASFTLAIEIGRIRDGAPRVLRLSELSATETRDLFEFDPEPAPTGAFKKVADPVDSQRILASRGLIDDDLP